MDGERLMISLSCLRSYRPLMAAGVRGGVGWGSNFSVEPWLLRDLPFSSRQYSTRVQTALSELSDLNKTKHEVGRESQGERGFWGGWERARTLKPNRAQTKAEELVGVEGRPQPGPEAKGNTVSKIEGKQEGGEKPRP